MPGPRVSIPLLPTTVVGSYPQPAWLIDPEKLLRRLPPRVRARDVWRVPEPLLAQAQDDATIVAVHEMERAGIDIVSDGEIRRESYSNHFATALAGIDLDTPGQTLSRSGTLTTVPRIVAPIRRTRPVQKRDVEFLRAHTDRPIKITLPGPFTMTQLAQDDYYGDESRLAMEFARVVNEELQDLVAAGADVVQIDEPYLQARAAHARQYAIAAINRALEGIGATRVLHTCFGYGLVVKNKHVGEGYPFLAELARADVQQVSIEAAQPELDPSALQQLGDKTVVLGVLDLGTTDVEPIELVERRIRAALRYVPPERLVVAPDCGMKYLPRQVAFEKLRAMTHAAQAVRESL